MRLFAGFLFAMVLGGSIAQAAYERSECAVSYVDSAIPAETLFERHQAGWSLHDQDFSGAGLCHFGYYHSDSKLTLAEQYAIDLTMPMSRAWYAFLAKRGERFAFVQHVNWGDPADDFEIPMWTRSGDVDRTRQLCSASLSRLEGYANEAMSNDEHFAYSYDSSRESYAYEALYFDTHATPEYHSVILREPRVEVQIKKDPATGSATLLYASAKTQLYVLCEFRPWKK